MSERSFKCVICGHTGALETFYVRHSDVPTCPTCGAGAGNILIAQGLTIIEWDEGGYPTQKSLERLRRTLSSDDVLKAIGAFYGALCENHWGPDWFGLERVEVRGEVVEVWGYHTGGWSGNEDIIHVLQRSWLWQYLLERYDAGGHYYFRPFDRLFRRVEEAGA